MFISIHDKIIENEIFLIDNVHYLRTFIWLLLNANPFDNKICNRGEMITTYKDISKALGFTLLTAKNHIKKLEDMNIIIKSRGYNSIKIFIKNYEKYQFNKKM